MSTPQDQPLWRLMCDAYCDATDSVARDTETIAIGNAAEIRAVAKAVPNTCLSAADVRHWLIDEADRADRAERGDAP